jgi:mRNA-degrading endonuclease YafQ of YafQ-DinJ toxin-antitoxin module
MYILVLTSKFQKQIARLVRGNRGLKIQLSKTFKLLNSDFDHPSLRSHKLSGTDNWSISVNQSIRIILHWEKDKLYLLEIGKHEDVYN